MQFSMRLGLTKMEDPLKVPYTDIEATTRISERLVHYLSEPVSSRDILIVCIGTDRSTGDSLGPLVGSKLRQLGFPHQYLFGTLDQPVHAMNLIDVLSDIRQRHQHPYIVAVDACLGQSSSVGHIQLGTGPVKPGAGVNKDLPPVGDIHLTGIVNVGGFMEYFVLQNTRLNIVFNMAEVIADAIFSAHQTHRSHSPTTKQASFVTLD